MPPVLSHTFTALGLRPCQKKVDYQDCSGDKNDVWVSALDGFSCWTVGFSGSLNVGLLNQEASIDPADEMREGKIRVISNCLSFQKLIPSNIYIQSADGL